jgi:hypothetical protein
MTNSMAASMGLCAGIRKPFPSVVGDQSAPGKLRIGPHGSPIIS